MWISWHFRIAIWPGWLPLGRRASRGDGGGRLDMAVLCKHMHNLCLVYSENLRPSNLTVVYMCICADIWMWRSQTREPTYMVERILGVKMLVLYIFFNQFGLACVCKCFKCMIACVHGYSRFNGITKRPTSDIEGDVNASSGTRSPHSLCRQSPKQRM